MVHQYKLGGYNIVLDSCSGGVHVVDEVAYDIIALYQEKSREEIVAAMEEKYAAHEDITTEDIEECYDQVTFDNFNIGAEYFGKKTPSTVPGGTVLVEGTFTIKE